MELLSYADLHAYKKNIDGLCAQTLERIDELVEVYHDYGFRRMNGLQDLINRINQDNFKVLVIGKFSTGKSSLINALLGDEVLPDSLNPCTAYINEVTYGDEPKAAVSFKNPLPPNWELWVQDEQVKAHILQHAGGQVPDYIVDDLDALADCVTIPYDEEEEEPIATLDNSPFAKAVIYYPSELCKNGIEIIDSPGLDESEDRTAVVDKYLKKVDAVIYVTTNIATGGDGDKEIIAQYLDSNEIKNVFFVCNLFGIKLAKAKKQLLPRLNKIFADKTLLGEQGIHLINIGDMLNSGIEEFKGALADYLNNERGRALLTDYIEKATELIEDIKEDITAYRFKADVKLEAVNAAIANLEERMQAEQKLLEEAKTIIRRASLNTEILCRNELTEKYKKYNYNAKVDVRDVDAGTKVLANIAQEAEAMELATWLAQRYAMVNEEGFKEYIQTGLRESIEQEVAADLALLQQAVDNFAGNMEAELLEAGHSLQWQNIAQVAANHGKGLTVALGLDLQHLLSYASLELEAMLEKIVKGVFYVYSSYRFDARGEKLTHELQEKLSLEIYEKIEREKRRIVNAIIKLVQQSMEQEMFAPLVNTLEQALEAEAAILAELNADRVATEEKLAQEQQQCCDNVEQLNQYEATLAGYQKEIV